MVKGPDSKAKSPWHESNYLGFETCSLNILVQSSYYSILNFFYLNIAFHNVYFRALF